MRIGFFTDGFLPNPDGVATSVYETAKELENRGHEVFIIAPKYPGYVDKSPKVIRLTSLKIHKEPETRISLHLPDKSLRKILSMDFDLIHGHSGGPTTLLGWEISRTKKIPFVVTYHTLWNRYTHYFLRGKVVTPKMMERATKIFGNRSDYLIAPTSRVESELRSYGVKKPIRVVPGGIDVDSFGKEGKGFLRGKINNKKGQIALYVGRLGREKSVDFLIRSFKEVYKNDPTVQFVIVGDGAERKKLENLAKRLKVDKNVHFLGYINNKEIHKVYKDADVFVFASTTETQGLVVPEAFASGVPVVVVDDPAYECVEDGKNGYLVKKETKDFALKVLSVLKNDELRHEMSRNAIESAQRFSIKTTTDDLEPVYFELLEKHNKESVSRVMAENLRSENALVFNVAFWATALLTRGLTLLFYHGTAYPQFILGGQPFSHASIGVLLVLLALAAIVKKRTLGFISLVLLGVGVALVADEAVNLIVGQATVGNYWNILNLIPLFAIGILSGFLIRNSKEEHPKFYINTKEQKHENPKDPMVSVVIPAYNESEFITPTLKSLLNQTYKNFEIIVVDNNSTDNTGEVAARYGARVLRQHVKGVAATRQVGYFEARGKIVASTDADSIVPENWVEKIVERYEKNKKISGFGGLNLLYSGAVDARAAGRYIFPLFWKLDAWLNGGYNMAGFNMSVNRDAFVKIGGFNSSLEMGEDIDLSQKLRTVGKVEIDPDLKVFSSGRRYKDGLLSGMMVYAPYWISKVILHKEKPFKFPAVRSEKTGSSVFEYLPLCITILFLAGLFYAANVQLGEQMRLF